MYAKISPVHGQRGIVAAGHYMATTAGLKMFAKGGNAIDAGVAAGFALAVLKPHQNSLGGECPILIYSPDDGCVKAISGQGTAPKNATLEWFKNHDIPVIPGDGFLGATVPGLFGAYATALLRYGRLSLRDVLEPALELAERGFPVYESLSNTLANLKDKFISEWPSSADVFTPGGRIPKVGEILVQPALARTIKRLADIGDSSGRRGREDAIKQAIDYFYKGKIAEEIVDFVHNKPVKDSTGKFHAALLTLDDLSSYETRIENPVYCDYRNYRVFKCGPWTQGPVFLQQLKLLEGFNLKNMGHNSAMYIHTVVECSKLAFADRDRYYGDPAFVHVPLDMLLSDQYNVSRRAKINAKRANNLPLWEDTRLSSDETYRGDTTHLDTVDEQGYMMSATPSGAWIPSSPVIPELGFPLGTRAQVFNIKEGHPNCLAPGKRPRTTLTPSIAYRDGKPWMAFGTPGGDMQDQWTLQFFLNVVEFGMNIQQAVDMATFHTTHFINSFYPHEKGDGTIFAEEGIQNDVLIKLQELGHRIHLDPSGSHGEVCAACINNDNGMMEGAASYKSERNARAMGW